ncbi:TetR family transcriptional regulator [Actinokineospora sp. 24-640]
MPRPRTISDQRLLDATSRVIAREGPGFTIAGVAAEAGVSVGTVAGRFGSKAGLLRALTAHFSARASVAMRAARDAAPDPVAGLVAAATVSYLDLGDATAAGNHLAQLGVDLQDPVLRSMLGENYAAAEAELERACAAAAPALPGMPPPARAARVLLALTNGGALDWSIRPSGRMVTRLTEDIDAVLEGWRRD